MIRETANAVGFTTQSTNGKWAASLLHKHGRIESWGHETRTKAESQVTYFGNKIGIRRIGQWKRS